MAKVPKKKGSKKRSKQGSEEPGSSQVAPPVVHLDDEDDFNGADDEEVSSGEDQEENERKHQKLLEAISALGGKRKTLGERSEASTHMSEFTVSAEGGSDKVQLSDLIRTVEAAPAVSARSRKQLKELQQSRRTVDCPLSKQETQRIHRDLAFKKTATEVSRWTGIISQNQRAEQLVFPLHQDPSGPRPMERVVMGWKAQTPLEQEVFALLSANQQPINDPVLTPAEEASVRAMSLEDAKIRRAELQKARALQSYYESKARREKKIKSKKYHRVQNKSKRKELLKNFEEMVKVDPEAALQELEKMELARMQERMSLKHQNSSKWARSRAIMAKYDLGARRAMQQQLEVNRELTQKMVTSLEEEEDEEVQEEEADLLPDFVNAAELQQDSSNPWMRARLSEEPAERKRSSTKAGGAAEEEEQEPEEEVLLREMDRRRKQRQAQDTDPGDIILIGEEEEEEEVTKDQTEKKQAEASDEEEEPEEEVLLREMDRRRKQRQAQDTDPGDIILIGEEEEEEVTKDQTEKKQAEASDEEEEPEEEVLLREMDRRRKQRQAQDCDPADVIIIGEEEEEEMTKDLTEEKQAEASEEEEVLLREMDKRRKQHQAQNSDPADVIIIGEEEVTKKQAEASDDDDGEEEEEPEEEGLSEFIRIFRGLTKNLTAPAAAGGASAPLEEGLIRIRSVQDAEDLPEDEPPQAPPPEPPQAPPPQSERPAGPSRKRKKGVKLREVLTEETKALAVPLAPTIVDSEEQLDQRGLVREAFAGDDVVSDFMQDKRKQEEAGKPKVLDLTLPGWGEWGGLGLKVSSRKRQRFRTKPTPLPSRKDRLLPSVIISEKRSSSVCLHQVSSLPFPFESCAQFESCMGSPLGRTWNTERTVKKVTKPRLLTRPGAIIEPMDEEELLKEPKTQTARR